MKVHPSYREATSIYRTLRASEVKLVPSRKRAVAAIRRLILTLRNSPSDSAEHDDTVMLNVIMQHTKIKHFNRDELLYVDDLYRYLLGEVGVL